MIDPHRQYGELDDAERARIDDHIRSLYLANHSYRSIRDALRDVNGVSISLSTLKAALDRLFGRPVKRRPNPPLPGAKAKPRAKSKPAPKAPPADAPQEPPDSDPEDDVRLSMAEIRESIDEILSDLTPDNWDDLTDSQRILALAQNRFHRQNVIQSIIDTKILATLIQSGPESPAQTRDELTMLLRLQKAYNRNISEDLRLVEQASGELDAEADPLSKYLDGDDTRRRQES